MVHTMVVQDCSPCSAIEWKFCSTIPHHEKVAAHLAAFAAALHAEEVAAASAACLTMQTFHASLPTRSIHHRRSQLCACQPHTVSQLFQGHGGPFA